MESIKKFQKMMLVQTGKKCCYILEYKKTVSKNDAGTDWNVKKF
jgi:hypothetical protein